MMIGKPHISLARIGHTAKTFCAYEKILPPEEFLFPVKQYFPVGAPEAIDHFFFATLQHCGLHRLAYRPDLAANAWTRPITGSARDWPRGSNLIFSITHDALARDPDVFRPDRLARISFPEFIRIFSDASGPIPLSDIGERWQLTRGYGAWFTASALTPRTLIERCATLPDPVAALFSMLSLIPGFREDPLRSKATRLARFLTMRPEHFLPPSDVLRSAVILDEDLVRVVLRMGMVVLGPHERGDNILRKEIGHDAAHRIRAAAAFAALALSDKAKIAIARTEYVMKTLGTTCSESTTPGCNICSFAQGCKKDTLAFQGILRTTAF